MKKYLLIFILSITVCLQSCQIHKINDLTRLNIKGSITEIRESDYKPIEKFGEILRGDKVESDILIFSTDIQLKFNKYGNMVQKNVFTKGDTLGISLNFEYDKDNRLSKIYSNSKIENNIKMDSLEFSNDVIFNEICSSLDSGNILKILFEYDIDNNKIIKDVYDCSNKFRIREIDKFKHGKRTETTAYNQDGKLNFRINYTYQNLGRKIEEEKYDQNGEILNICVKKLDLQNRVIDERHFRNSNKIISLKTQKFKNGLLIECFSDLPPLNELFKPVKNTYTYIIDDQGNWIQRITWNDNKPITFTERSITYN